MYNFIDVTDTASESVLPSEAMQINGRYIEDLIPGYRTLNVSGREALSPDVVSYTTGVRDGSKIQNKRYPERIIVVRYQLIAESNEAFREAYNRLGGILDVQDAELIFADETDKYFIGTPCIIGSVDPGRNAVTGEFEILCADPFKYSVIEYEAEPDATAGCVMLDYNGTYKAYPILEADFYEEDDANATLTGAGDCGYVAFFNENEKVVQLGKPEELDSTESYAKSQTLVNSAFNTESAWNQGNPTHWKQNSGVTPSGMAQGGSVGTGVATYAAATTPAPTTGTLLTAKSTANQPVINYKLTAKASGRTETSVKVEVVITTSLAKSSNYFGRGYGLVGHVYIGGAWRTITLKPTSAYWSGNSGHTVTLSVTVTGLSASTTLLSGIKFKVTRADSLGTAGILDETNCSNLTISRFTSKTAESYYLEATGYGSGTGWHGATITRTFPADASGVVGATNFTFSYANKFSIGDSNNATAEKGLFQAALVADGKVIAAAGIHKGNNGKSATLQFYVNGKLVHSESVDVSHGNNRFTASKSTTITKTGQTVSFNVCGIAKSFNDSEIENIAVTSCTFGFAQYSGYTALAYNGLFWAKFVKHNCNTLKNIPNKFSANDVLEADCKSGKIYLNGVLTPSLGTLGNDWEEFYLVPGLNQIGVAYSEWVPAEYAPAFKVRYREVFL